MFQFCLCFDLLCQYFFFCTIRRIIINILQSCLCFGRGLRLFLRLCSFSVKVFKSVSIFFAKFLLCQLKYLPVITYISIQKGIKNIKRYIFLSGFFNVSYVHLSYSVLFSCFLISASTISSPVRLSSCALDSLESPSFTVQFISQVEHLSSSSFVTFPFL